MAAVFGDPRFTPSGFSLTVDTPLPPGAYTVQALARSTVTGTFNNSVTASVNVQPPASNPFMALDAPVSGALLTVPFIAAGWAIDAGAPTGTGIDQVDVWAYPRAGGGSVFLGTATWGGSRSAGRR